MVRSDNKTMRLGVILALVALVTMIGLSATFAKYISTGSGEDEARVAKWGVVITQNDSGLFSDAYNKETHTAHGTAGNTVEASVKAQRLVAPGTAGSDTGGAITISGQPEVAGKVTIEGTFSLKNDEDTYSDWYVPKDPTDPLQGTKFYCPLLITVDNQTFDGSTYSDPAVFENAVKAKMASAYTFYFKPNEDLSTKLPAAGLISWRWAFDTSAAIHATNQNDTDDTALGNVAAAKGANGNSVTLGYKATAEQTQEVHS